MTFEYYSVGLIVAYIQLCKFSLKSNNKYLDLL